MQSRDALSRAVAADNAKYLHEQQMAAAEAATRPQAADLLARLAGTRTHAHTAASNETVYDFFRDLDYADPDRS